MEPRKKSTPELILEAAEAHRLAGLTIGLGEELLERAKEVGRRVEERVRQAMAVGRVGPFAEG
jgi:hypothetical protein